MQDAGDGSIASDVSPPVDAAMDEDASPPSPPRGPRYDEVQQKSIHNAYDKDEPLFDHVVFHRVHSLELDIHVGKSFQPALTGDWYVYHADLPGVDRTTCKKLSDCLGVLRSVHDAFPKHEIITVLVDLKDDFKAGQAPPDLDALIDKTVGKANVLSPADLLAACPAAKTLREAVTGACTWPALADVRGKFVFVMTGGNACAPGSRLGVYDGEGQTASQRLGFIAPSIDDTCTFPKYASAPHAIFFNLDASHMAIAKDVHAAGLVARVYYGGITGGLDDAMQFNAARADEAHHLATDKANYQYDPWTIMHGPKGWPFVCFGSCDAPTDEQGMRLLGFDVRSGDIDGTSDSFFFAHDTQMGQTWSAAISVASSHVEPYAKGCIMARATLDADSPYVAVCRPADAHPIRAQARLAKGAGTQIKEGVAPSTLTSESLFFARLSFSGMTAKAEASADGATWQTIASYTFVAPLALQGIAVSGHSSPDAVRFLFGNLARDGVAIDASKLPKRTCIGSSCPVQDVFDGPLP